MFTEATPQSSPMTADRLLSAAQVALLLSVKRKRVYELPLPYVQLGIRSKRWRLADVESFIAQRRKEAP